MITDTLKHIKGLVKNEIQSEEAALVRLKALLAAIEDLENAQVDPGEVVARFILERCIIEPQAITSHTKLFNAFELFRAGEISPKYIKKSVFFAALEAAGYDVIQDAIIEGKRTQAVAGLRIKGRREELDEEREGLEAVYKDPDQAIREVIQARIISRAREEDERFKGLLENIEPDPDPEEGR